MIRGSRFFGAVLFVVASFAAHAQCPASFDAPPSYLFGDLYELEDFDGDGYLDAFTAPREGTSVRLSRGNRGVFTRGPLIDLGEIIRGSAAGDFNNDGRLDAMVITAGGHAFFLAGRGDGTFDAPRTVATFTNPWAAHGDDLDGDGNLDIIVANLQDTVDVLWGKGDGTFESARISFTPAFYPNAVASGDVNDDGRSDIIIGHEGGAITVTLVGPDRTLGEPLRMDNRGFVYGMQVHDLDGDGHLDIITADPVAFTITIYKGKGDGTFANRTEFAAGAYTEGLDFGDFTGDGRTDIVAGQSIQGSLVILPGLGNMQFGTPVEHSAGNNVYGVRVNDLDRDGDDDILTLDAGGFSVLLQQKPGQFPQIETESIGGRLGPYDIATADFNNDGVPDLVTANALHNSVSILPGNPDGTFADPGFAFTGRGSYRVITPDVNGDGNADIVTANIDSDDVGVVLGRGDGTFHSGARYDADPSPHAISHGDIDGDGDQDLLVSALQSAKINVFLNAGNGTFTRGIDIASRAPGETVLADLNRDGKLDLAIADRIDPIDIRRGTLTLRFGNDDGTFGEPRDFEAGDQPIDLVAHDFNRDSRLDFAIANYASFNIIILLDDGNGGYARVADLPLFGTAPHIVVADLNVDGIADIAAANAGLVVVYEGRGDGQFREATGYRAGNTPFAIAAADFNRDGRNDLVVAHLISSDVAILKNATACRQRAVRK